MPRFLAAAIQMTSTSDEEANWQSAQTLVERAADYGARFVATPENANFLGPPREKVRRAEPLDVERSSACRRFSRLAERLSIHLLLGSFNEASDDPERCHNTSVLFSPAGEIVAAYRKMHLMDVDVSERVRFVESADVKPGDETVVAQTPLGKIGLSVCYDLRFAELYQKLRDDGAEILTVPSAFTLTTGRAHWYPLLRARAIETQSWVISPAQYGQHDDRGLRETYGHALIVDPWGQVVAAASDGPGLALAEVDVDLAHEIRRKMPVADHRRL